MAKRNILYSSPRQKRKTPEQEQFEKDYTALKHYLIGRDYLPALRALGMAEQVHRGFRKDGVTPEFHHQVNICFTIINLRGVLDEGTALAAALLHDVIEDYDLPERDIELLVGPDILEVAKSLDKRNKADLSRSMVGSIVKGADNCDNTLSMIGVFDPVKMEAYIKRTENEILPMLKKASKNFPDQQLAYGGLTALLKKQVYLNREWLGIARHREIWLKQQAEHRQLKMDLEAFKLGFDNAKDCHKSAEAEVKELQAQLDELKDTKIGEKARRVIAISELYKEVVLPRPNADSFKKVFEILINKWQLHPSSLTLLDDDKLDVDSVLKRL